MSIQMYDLAAADPAVRFSPYCWRIRMALAHKGLPVETIAWRFTDKPVIAFSGQGSVPVLVDERRVVVDSAAIADYLDETYPERPRLVDGPQSCALTRFIREWTQSVIQAAILPIILRDLYGALAEQDKVYFRASREKRLGRSLEDFAVSPETGAPILAKALAPARQTLSGQPFLCGAEPAFADYVLFGAFQWARAVSPIELLEEGDSLHSWRNRMLDLFDGLARRSPRAAPPREAPSY